jgi:hypothetical protein
MARNETYPHAYYRLATGAGEDAALHTERRSESWSAFEIIARNGKRMISQLTLFADYSKPPEVDGAAINYSPAKCYDSPFIQGDWGSGVVTIQDGDRKLVLNFNE